MPGGFMKYLKASFVVTLIAASTTLCVNITHAAEPKTFTTIEELVQQQNADNALEDMITKDLEGLLLESPLDPTTINNELFTYCQNGINCFSMKQYEQAIAFFEHIVKTQDALSYNREAVIQAYRYLGRIHYHGYGVIKDRTQALTYFNMLLTIVDIETINFIAWLEAKAHIGSACYFDKQYQAAREHFESIYNVIQTKKLDVETIKNRAWVDAYALLAKIYFFGFDDNKNITKAAELFLVVAQSNFAQQNYPYMNIEALLYVGKIYYSKELYSTAQYYLTKITTHKELAMKNNVNAYNKACALLKEIEKITKKTN